MKTDKELIISVAGKILLQEGLHDLSIDNLSRKGNIPYSEIYKYVKSDSEIIDLIAGHMQRDKKSNVGKQNIPQFSSATSR